MFHSPIESTPTGQPASVADDAEAYVCANLIADHPSCPDGQPYWKVTAVIHDIIGAKRWAGRDGIIVRLPVAMADECWRNRVLTSAMIDLAEVA